jgi:hypothetical protein
MSMSLQNNTGNESLTQNFINSNYYLEINDLKWINYFLIGFLIFEIIFLLGFTLISIVVYILMIYISFKIIQILQNEVLSLDLEFSAVARLLKSLNFIVLVTIGLCVIDLFVSKFLMSDFLKLLQNSNDIYENKFVYFSLFVLIFRIIFLGFIWYYIRKIINMGDSEEASPFFDKNSI